MPEDPEGTPEALAGASAGCERCLLGDPDHAASMLRLDVDVGGTHHEGLLLKRCANCGTPVLQHWLEFLDWNDRWGGDQFWTHWTPLTEAESQVLREQVQGGKREVAEQLARSLSKSRRHLTRDSDFRFRWKEGPDASDILYPC